MNEAGDSGARGAAMTEMEILRLRLYVDYMQMVRCLIEIKNVIFEQQIKAGFNPMQPRVPAGNSDGGQWTESGGGFTRPRLTRNPPQNLLRRDIADKPRAQKPNPHADSPYYDPVYDIYDPPIEPTWSPLDLVGAGSVFKVARSFGSNTVMEGVAALRVLLGRISKKPAAEESEEKIRLAADAIEEFLGGKPDPKDVIINSDGDIIIMKGDKKFRMDINKPGLKRMPDGKLVPDEPHFHFQELKNGKWVDATEGHRYYFKKG